MREGAVKPNSREILISEVENGYVLEFDPQNEQPKFTGDAKIFVAKTPKECAELVLKLLKAPKAP